MAILRRLNTVVLEITIWDDTGDGIASRRMWPLKYTEHAKTPGIGEFSNTPPFERYLVVASKCLLDCVDCVDLLLLQHLLASV